MLKKEQTKQLRLAEQVRIGELHAGNMSDGDFSRLLQMASNGSSLQEWLALSRQALIPIVEAFQYDEHNPFWFNNHTHFDDDIWNIKFDQVVRVINFKIELYDGLLLTSKEHRSLLNAFKYWIVSQGNPYYNGGKVLKPVSVLQKVKKCIHLINALLISSMKIHLAELHLSAITQDVVLDIITHLARFGIEDGVYCFHEKLTSYLVSHLSEVSDLDLASFEAMFPYSKRKVLEEEKSLNLSDIQLRKARCYLYLHGAYKKTSITHLPNSVYFRKLYPNFLCADLLTFSGIDELAISCINNEKEFNAVPVKNDDDEGIVSSRVSVYLSCFRSLSVVNAHSQVSQISAEIFKGISLARIEQHVSLRDVGRFSTLPAPVVFKSIKDAFEFAIIYIDDILDAIFSVVENSPCAQRDETIFREYKKNTFKRYIPNSIIRCGVTQWKVLDSDKNAFVKRRLNKGLADLFDVLMGAIQLLVGVTMARRQSELIDLSPIDCLFPSELDPDLNRSEEFELKFNNRKSGMGGKYSMNEPLSKPILNSVARLVFKLQNFNKRLIDSNICKLSQISLFTRLIHKDMNLVKVQASSYYRNIDAFCDYFEIQTIQISDGDIRRFYLRQHQLRRFFAMVFFWSKGFDGLDTLRHFLGHTDSEHLYHYVTEGISGEMLAGVKAKVLLDGISRDYIENIHQLEPILRNYFGSSSLKISSLSGSIEEYDDIDFTTSPSIESLKEQSEYENLIIDLITNHIIDLQPEFFTLKLPDGTESRDFNLVLHVFEKED